MKIGKTLTELLKRFVFQTPEQQKLECERKLEELAKLDQRKKQRRRDYLSEKYSNWRDIARPVLAEIIMERPELASEFPYSTWRRNKGYGASFYDFEMNSNEVTKRSDGTYIITTYAGSKEMSPHPESIDDNFGKGYSLETVAKRVSHNLFYRCLKREDRLNLLNWLKSRYSIDLKKEIKNRRPHEN